MDTEVQSDSEALAIVLELLEAKVPLCAWPTHALGALAQALAPTSNNRLENAKAERLERHLFAGPRPVGLVDVATGRARSAERLRADLADLVPHGAGLHLLAGPP